MNRKHLRAAGFASVFALAGMAAIPNRAPADEASAAGISLVADLSDRELYVRRGDETIRTYTVAVGHPKHPTPRGNFRVRRVVWNPAWVPPDAEWAKDKKPRAPGDPKNPVGRVKMFFQEPDYYIHGTRETDSLGQAESKGCIRMRNGDVISLAKLVMENGGSSRPPAWYRRVINSVRRTREVYLDESIPLTVRT